MLEEAIYRVLQALTFHLHQIDYYVLFGISNSRSKTKCHNSWYLNLMNDYFLLKTSNVF